MSKPLSLNLQDALKGLIVAVFSAVITFLYSLVTMPSFAFTDISLKQMGTVAFIALVSYLAKNFLTDEEGKFLGF
jgi:uncharacterized MnhB-related membrane protein